jgi:hypothetical protein
LVFEKEEMNVVGQASSVYGPEGIERTQYQDCAKLRDFGVQFVYWRDRLVQEQYRWWTYKHLLSKLGPQERKATFAVSTGIQNPYDTVLQERAISGISTNNCQTEY